MQFIDTVVLLHKTFSEVLGRMFIAFLLKVHNTSLALPLNKANPSLEMLSIVWQRLHWQEKRIINHKGPFSLICLFSFRFIWPCFSEMFLVMVEFVYSIFQLSMSSLNISSVLWANKVAFRNCIKVVFNRFERLYLNIWRSWRVSLSVTTCYLLP